MSDNFSVISVKTEDGTVGNITIDETTPEVIERVAKGESVDTAVAGVVMDIKQGDITKYGTFVESEECAECSPEATPEEIKPE